MASLIEGFECDIFISYRQKDNRHERWVTEFVEHLKGELEATFKEDVSIYFDENPHDGLLETHDVDASLKDKLKCLVFIPILSRTYCDPKSFAWEHEFKAFVEQASADRFGLKIRLPNGNVASRVLPVRIHDLDISDINLCESVLGSIIRGVDFVYKEPGVNRPLTREDDEEKNLNRTRYKNQINKTANSIREIISGFQMKQTSDKQEVLLNASEPPGKGSGISRVSLHVPSFIRKLKKWQVLMIPFILLAVTYLIYKILVPGNNNSGLSEPETSVAVIPFTDLSATVRNSNFTDAITLNLISQLFKISGFRVQPWPAVIQYKGTTEKPRIIGRKLKTDYLIYGNVQVIQDQTLIKVQLINSRTGSYLWDADFKENPENPDYISGEIPKQIAIRLKTFLTPEEIEKIDEKTTANPDAFRDYLSGNLVSNNAYLYGAFGKKLVDSTSFNSAISEYDNAIKYDSLFALAYARRAIATAWGFYLNQVDSTYIQKCKNDIDRALSLDKDLKDAQLALGFYYYYCKSDYRNALHCFNKAAVKDEQDYQPLFYMAMVYRRMGEWEKSLDLISRVKRFSPQEALYLTNIGLSYNLMHHYDSALVYHQKAIDALPVWSFSYYNKIETMILKDARIAEARILFDTAVRRTGEELRELKIRLDIYEGKYADALREAEESVSADFEINGRRELFLAKIYSILSNPVNASRYYDTAVIKLNDGIIKGRNTAEINGLLGIAYAGSGNEGKAMESVKRAFSVAEKNRMDESDVTINLAEIYTMNGDYENAIRTIEHLLTNPSCFSVKLLQIDPVYWPLANQPGFKTILEKYSEN